MLPLSSIPCLTGSDITRTRLLVCEALVGKVRRLTAPATRAHSHALVMASHCAGPFVHRLSQQEAAMKTVISSASASRPSRF
jgi:hypothetical protein